jgi:hypothetical protein
MSRSEASHDAIPRAVPYPLQRGFADHLRALEEMYGRDFHAVASLGNPDAVRVVACKQDGCAFEYMASDGAYHGALTGTLLEIWAEVDGAPVSWAAIEPALRGRVQSRFAAQRPMIEGPARRRLFSLDEQAGSAEIVPIIDMGDGFQLETGRLMGAMVGDVYGVMPTGSRTYDAANAVAEARIARISATIAEVPALDWKHGCTQLPPNAVAIPVETQAVRRPIAVDVPDSMRAEVERKIAEARTLRVAGPDDAVALATLRVVGTTLTVEDRAGLRWPPAEFPAGLRAAIDHLADLGAAQAVRDLEGEHGVLASELEIEWGTVELEHTQRMPEHGGALALDDKLYLRVKTTSARRLYVHVFNIGLGGQIQSLTRFAPAGAQLWEHSPELLLGEDPDGSVPGLALSWPAAIPRDGTPRVDELIVAVTSAPANLQCLETGGPPAAPRGGGSRLENLISQVRNGLPRNSRAEQAIDGFFVKRLSYLLHPRDAVMADTAFAIDRNPLRQAATRVPDAWNARDGAARPSGTISIELEALAVENLEVPSTDIRVDALVCTRSRAAAGYHSWTQRGPGALTRQVLFHGPVLDFVDLYIWVSRDAPGSPELTQLLAQRAVTPAFQDAARAFLVGNDRTSGPWTAAAGASAVLARMARDAVLAVAGSCIGLYRASFLAQDRFGTGRHLEVSAQRTRKFSVALQIEHNTPDQGAR